MAGQGSGSGLATAVELLGGIGDLGGEGEQPELFADADDAPLPMPDAPVRTGRPGRPRGARNRSTEEWRGYILSRYRSPAVFLAEMYSRTPAELARQLGLYKFHEGKLVTAAVRDPETGEERQEAVLATGDAAAMQQAAAIALLPYVHQKQPLAIEAKSESRGMVMLDFGTFAQMDDGDVLRLPIAPADQGEQNQEVSDAEVVKSDGEKSDGETKR